ncbi:c-type cytochrome [Aurantiacibacter gilvus]|uniref:Cytochrome c n=1 Tax=Aurantiacibacter gilvus TaxID=3139141 RepID=A0ABU9IBA7_9SPHN
MAVKANTIGKVALAALAASTLAMGVSGASATDAETTDAAEEAPLTEDQIAASRALFGQYGCSACHLFADAGGSGHIGPALDGNSGLSVDYVEQIVTNGQGAMPSFGGMVSEEELHTLSRYIVEKKQ